jgi:hypothetical protein
MNNRPRIKRNKQTRRRWASRHVVNRRAEPTREQEKLADRMVADWVRLAI